jgi:sulfotransferase
MDKTYHFLAGLPRSGNTLLSALLNQNPDIYSTPLSPLPSFMWEFANSADNMEQVNRNVENKIKAEIFLSSFMDNYYKEVEKPIVIDREKAWGTPANLGIVKKYVTPTPKIIFTVRDVLEILASFVKMDAQYLKNDAANKGYYMNNYRSPKDTVCEHLMAPNSDIDKGLLSLASAFYPENAGMFHIVEYNNLVLNPEETMNKIYDFLELPHYEHNFNKIEKVEQDNDEAIGLPKDLHEIRKSLSQSSTNLDTLSDYIRHKYSNMEFWRDNSLMKVRGKDF